MKHVKLHPVRREYRVNDQVTIDLAGVELDDNSTVEMWMAFRTRPGAPVQKLPLLSNTHWSTIAGTNLTFRPTNPGLYTLVLVGLFTSASSPTSVGVTYRGVTFRAF